MEKLLVFSVLLIAVLASPRHCTGRPPPYKPWLIRKEQTVGPYRAYTTSPRRVPNAAVIMASDVYGFKAPLLRQFADRTASEGYFVVVPDFFNGDPYVDNVTNFSTWIEKHEPVGAVRGAEQVIKVLQKGGFSFIGAVGFCWGGKVGVELAKGRSLKAVVVAHPSLVTVDDIKEVRTPLAILAAELDTITPSSLIRQFITVLEAKTELKSFARIYPGVAHGWTIRYNASDSQAVANAEKAHREMLAWLGTFLHKQKKSNK